MVASDRGAIVEWNLRSRHLTRSQTPEAACNASIKVTSQKRAISLAILLGVTCLASSLGSAGTLAPRAAVAGGEGNWVDVIDKVAVRIETVLYETKDHRNFFVHVELRNQTPYDIGVDLSDSSMVLYPNQWGGSDLDHRMVVDEEFLPPKELDKPLRARVVEAFRSKRLTVLAPGKSVDNYTNFNASGRRDVQAAKGKFILISIQGQLVFTDGADVWDVRPSRDLAIRTPVTWKSVPLNARVIER